MATAKPSRSAFSLISSRPNHSTNAPQPLVATFAGTRATRRVRTSVWSQRRRSRRSSQRRRLGGGGASGRARSESITGRRDVGPGRGRPRGRGGSCRTAWRHPPPRPAGRPSRRSRPGRGRPAPPAWRRRGTGRRGRGGTWGGSGSRLGDRRLGADRGAAVRDGNDAKRAARMKGARLERTGFGRRIRRARSPSELADQPDLRLELVAQLAAHGLAGVVDEPPDLGRARAAEVDDDVGVLVEDPCAAVDIALEAALVDEAARADALDLLEDRAGAGVEPQVGVALVAPGEVLAHDVAQVVHRLRLEAERDRERDVLPLVQHGVVVAELHVLETDGAAFALLRQQLAGLEDLGDEAGALALGRRREEVQVLPARAAHRAGDADVVVQPAEPAVDARD